MPSGDPMDEAPAESPDGVDLSLIRWSLGLSPAERLAALQSFVTQASELRAAVTPAVIATLLVEQGEKDRQDDPVLGAAGVGLHLDERRKVEHTKRGGAVVDEHRMFEQLGIAALVVKCAEAIERSQSGREEYLPGAGEMRLRRGELSTSGIPEHGVDAFEHLCQPSDVLWRPVGNDVEVAGGDRRAVKHGRDATDDHEVDFRLDQLAEEPG